MALGRDVVDAIIREHSYQPITGDVLLIGQQTVNLSRDEVLELMREHGVATAGLDTPTIALKENDIGADRGMSAVAFFKLLGVAAVRTLDIHDLEKPLPDDQANSADFMVDGGAITDLFGPGIVLSNYATLLRPGGRLIAINNLSGHFDPYSMPTAQWYLDFCVINDFKDCKIYVLVYPPEQPSSAFYLDIDCLLDPAREVRALLSPHEMAVVLFAEKGPVSTNSKTPTHARLRSSVEWQRYRETLGGIKLNARPHLVRSRSDICEVDVRGGHLFIKTDYTAVDPSAAGQSGAARTDPSAAGQSSAARTGPLRPQLKILCVGTGRDGTQSLCDMVQHVFSGSDRKVMHEYCCREFYQTFCDFAETGDGGYDDALKHMVADCGYECIVGNGYAAILPLFAERYGRGLKIVHVWRANRDACIASLIKNCELFPTAYRYYATNSDAVVKRMAAFHFGEMSREEWDDLPIEEKFGWYYDKTHVLVRKHLDLFDEHIEITTESLNDDSTRHAIADFIGGDGHVLPPRAHLNASVIDIASFPKEQQHKMHWLMGRLNIEDLARDEVYGLEYFLDKFVAWSGYQIADVHDAQMESVPVGQIASDLDRAVKVINKRLREIEALRQLALDRKGAE
jgi:SAM-dependent methyltransferase